MNRQQRRAMGGDPLNSPCSITEAVQIARGVAEDVIADFQHRTSPMHVAMSLQLEVLKEMLFEKVVEGDIIHESILSEEDFRERYIKRAKEFNEMQKAQLEKSSESNAKDNSPNMEPSVSDIEVQKV